MQCSRLLADDWHASGDYQNNHVEWDCTDLRIYFSLRMVVTCRILNCRTSIQAPTLCIRHAHFRGPRNNVLVDHSGYFISGRPASEIIIFPKARTTATLLDQHNGTWRLAPHQPGRQEIGDNHVSNRGRSLLSHHCRITFWGIKVHWGKAKRPFRQGRTDPKGNAKQFSGSGEQRPTATAKGPSDHRPSGSTIDNPISRAGPAPTFWFDFRRWNSVSLEAFGKKLKSHAIWACPETNAAPNKAYGIAHLEPRVYLKICTLS